MSEQTFNTRIVHKHDIEVNWNKAVNFVPKAGELIVYDADENYNYPRLKLGDGIKKVVELPFATQGALQSDWNQHDSVQPDHILNRTHFDSRHIKTTSIFYDGTIEGKEALPIEEGVYIVKISEETPSIDQILGQEGTICYGGEMITDIITPDYIAAEPGIPVYIVLDLLFVILEDMEFEGMPFTKGTYTMVQFEGEAPVFYVAGLKFENQYGELKTLDVKYLPKESIITTKEINQICFGDLESNSWARIRQLSDAGIAKNCWSVGDCKAVHLQGTMGTKTIDQELYLYILGFDHNAEKEGYGITFGGFKTAAGTDGIDICLADDGYGGWYSDGTKYFNMHHWGWDNYGGWARSDIRYDILGSTDIAPQGYGARATIGQIGYSATENCPLNPVSNTLMSCLPKELREVLKPIVKYTDNVGGGTGHIESNISGIIDYLPLLGVYEIFNETQAWGANEFEKKYQQQYEYYARGNSRIKYLDTDNTESAWWWERSPYYNYTTYFCTVYTGGGADRYSADRSSGIAPALLV